MTSALASNPRRVHVVPLPESRPPVVPPDEVFATPASAFVQDSLALDFRVDDEFFDHQATRRADLPDPTPLVTALAQAFVEVMAGLRPPPQVSRWTSPEVYAALCRRAAVAARRGPASRRPDLAPVFSFNAEGLWQGVGPSAAGDPVARLSRWRDVLNKAKTEGWW